MVVLLEGTGIEMHGRHDAPTCGDSFLFIVLPMLCNVVRQRIFWVGGAQKGLDTAASIHKVLS